MNSNKLQQFAASAIEDEEERHFKSRETTTGQNLHSSSLLNNKNNSMADMFCNTPSFDPGSKVSDFMDSNLSNTHD